MEYVVGVLFGMAALVGLLLFRRQYRWLTPRLHLSCHRHYAPMAKYEVQC